VNEITNICLGRLVNRGSGFLNPDFNIAGFSPYVSTPDAQAVRALLQLGYTSSDYYVAALLSAIYSSPEWWPRYDFSKELWQLETYLPPPDSISGAIWVQDGAGAPIQAFRPHQLPAPTDWTFQWQGSQVIAVTGNPGNRQFVWPCRQVVDPSGDFLYITWPDWLGWSGGVQVPGSWASGASFTIHHEPKAFPYKAAAAAIGASPNGVALLQDAGLQDAFFLTYLPVKQLAVAAVALYEATTQ
jgi:hypothetical protein